VLTLSGAEWALLAEAIVLIPYIELGLRLFPLDRLLATLGRDGRPRRPGHDMDLERTARIIEALFRHSPVRPSCLKKSLVLLRVARRRGLPAELRIGVTKSGGELLAHAWIECAGRPLFPGDEVERYSALPPITAAALAAARAGSASFVTEDHI
jgi:hypothetical protein